MGGGASSSWTVTSHSPLFEYCATYDLCTTWYAFDGTVDDLLGKSIDFAGPHSNSGPWTFTIDMGTQQRYTHWRVAGQTHYAMGDVSLRYEDSAGRMITVPGSGFTWDRTTGGLQAMTFTQEVTARVWQVYISSHGNTDSQSRYQLYLTEVQFGVGSSDGSAASMLQVPICGRGRGRG